MPRLLLRIACALGACSLAASPALAQATGGTLAGRVVAAGGAPVAQASVSATFIPTGARYGAVTADDGRYVIANAHTGGPYVVVVRRVGLKPETREDVFLALGATTRLDIVMTEVATTLATVSITADPSSLTLRTGPSTNVGRALLENLPTLGRSLQDMTRLVPQGNANSFAGTNFRYNNITIDGAANNDVFSFSPSQGGISGVGPSGTPGAGARTQPISLDAIEEVQVVLAPFDVKLGNFTGGSVNAVTRGGTNETTGSFYSFGRNQTLTGKSADEARLPIASYTDYQLGGRIGGAIAKNKTFYFLNIDVAHRDEPIGYAPGDLGVVVDATTAKALSDTLKARYGYDGGSISSFTNVNDNRKVFGRLDFNLSDVHKLNIRHNYVNAHAQNLTRGAFLTKFGGQDFTQFNTTNSTVAELKSSWDNGTANSAIVGLSFTRDRRDFPGTIFPQIEINGTSGSQIFLGTDREASVFGIKTNVAELTDNLTISRGIHNITLGTHNEFYGVQYNFMNAYNGRWQYSSLANFYANKPSRIRGQYDLFDNSLANVKGTPQADFHVMWPSVYAQDEITLLGDKLHLTPGLRVDMVRFPDAIPTNPALMATPAFASYTNDFRSSTYVSPRIAFNYDVKGNGDFVVRGGTGRFTGRVPFAWFAYAYENTGLKVGNVDCRPSATSGCAGNSATVPLVTDPSQLKNLQAGVFEANLVDNSFKMPTVNRSSLAFDYKIGGGVTATVEGLYTKTVNDVKFVNIGLKDSTVASSVDGRPVFQGSSTQLRVNPNFTSVFLLTNTNEGDRYSITGLLRKTVPSLGFTGSAAYTYGKSQDVSNGIRNSPQSNWEFNQVADPRNPAKSLSNFDLRHRVIANLAWQHASERGYNSAVSLVFSGVSGSPFTFVYASDANRDGSGANDLIYVPRDLADARIVPAAGDTRTAAQIWAQLDEFISSQPGLNAARGSIVGRNAGRTPWNKQVDLRLSQDVPLVRGTRNRAQFTLDVINLGALLGTTWGRQYFVPNESNYNFQTLKVTKSDATGVPVGFTFDPVPNNAPWQYDALNSRYQAQLGFRYLF